VRTENLDSTRPILICDHSITRFDSKRDLEAVVASQANLHTLLAAVKSRAPELVGEQRLIDAVREIAEAVVAECVAQRLAAPADVPNLEQAKAAQRKTLNGPYVGLIGSGVSGVLSGNISNGSGLTAQEVMDKIAAADMQLLKEDVKQRFMEHQLKLNMRPKLDPTDFGVISIDNTIP
jgi:hypothetical protein